MTDAIAPAKPARDRRIVMHAPGKRKGFCLCGKRSDGLGLNRGAFRLSNVHVSDDFAKCEDTAKWRRCTKCAERFGR